MLKLVLIFALTLPSLSFGKRIINSGKKWRQQKVKEFKGKSMDAYHRRKKYLYRLYRQGKISRDEYTAGTELNTQLKGKWNPQFENYSNKDIEKWVREKQKNVKSGKHRRPADQRFNRMEGPSMQYRKKHKIPGKSSSWWNIFD